MTEPEPSQDRGAGPDAVTIRASDPVDFEKLLANAGYILWELAGFRQCAFEAASQVTHAVGMAETEYGREFTQRPGRQLPSQPCGHMSDDRLGTKLTE
jgi:hypothetical protein